MRKIKCILSGLALRFALFAQGGDTSHVTIQTNFGTMKAILYNDVPNHTRPFIERAKRGDFDGTLLTRGIKEFMIK